MGNEPPQRTRAPRRVQNLNPVAEQTQICVGYATGRSRQRISFMGKYILSLPEHYFPNSVRRYNRCFHRRRTAAAPVDLLFLVLPDSAEHRLKLTRDWNNWNGTVRDRHARSTRRADSSGTRRPKRQISADAIFRNGHRPQAPHAGPDITIRTLHTSLTQLSGRSTVVSGVISYSVWVSAWDSFGC